MLTLHLLLAKFFRICRLTDSCMFLQRAVPPAILKINTKNNNNSNIQIIHIIGEIISICIRYSLGIILMLLSYLLGLFIFIFD